MSNKLSLLVNFIGVDKMSKSLRSIVGLGSKGADSLNKLKGKAADLRKEIDAVEEVLRKSNWKNTSGIDERARKLGAYEDMLKRVRREQLALIEAESRQMAKTGRRWQADGKQQIMQGGAMLAPLVLAAKSGADFSSQLVDIQQKANLTNLQMVAVRENIRAAARDARQMPSDMAAAVDTLAGLGMAVQDSAKLAAPMGRFMTAFKVEGTDAAAAIYAGLNTMNIPLERSGKFFDMMAEAGNIGAFEVRDMAAALPGLTAQMSALGQTGEQGAAEVMAMLETIRISSGTSEKAATQASDLLNKLTAPTTLTAFGKAGIDAMAEIKKGIEQGISPLETMIRLTKQATGNDLMRMQEFFAEKDSSAAMRALIQEYDKFTEAKKQLAKADGTTAAAFDQRVANDQTVSLREIGIAMSDLALSIAPILLPVMKETARIITSVVGAARKWADENPALAGSLVKLVAGLAAFKIGAGATKFALGGLLGPLSTGIKYFRLYRELGSIAAVFPRTASIISGAARVIGPVFKLMRSGALLLAKGMMRAGIMMLTNPMVAALVLLGVVIAGVAYLVYKNWDRIKEAFSSSVDWVKEKIGSLPDWMKNIGANIMSGLLMAINPMALAARLLDVARNGITAFKNYFGIKSPSRLMMEMGSHVTHGLARGLDGGAQRPVRAMGAMAGRVAAAGAIALSPVGVSASTPASGGERSITINIYQQPGQDARALAREVRRQLERLDAQRARGSYQDDI